MVPDGVPSPNRFGYAVLGSATLALGLLLVGGAAYAPHAAFFLLAAAFCASWALRRTRTPTDGSDESDRSDAEERREKEVKLESGGFGGNGGGV